MSLKGNAECLGLVEILEILHASGHSGILKISNDQSVKVLRFVEGTPHFPKYDRNATYKIGTLLLRATALTPDQLEQALAIQKEHRGLLGEIIVQAGFVSDEDVLRALSQQYKEEVFDLFLWERAHFEFTKDLLPDGFIQDVESGRALALSVPTIAVEAANRVDEWKRIHRAIPSLKAIMEEVAGQEAAIDKALARAKIDPRAIRFDGRANLAMVFEAWGSTLFESYRIVFKLLQEGRIALAGDEHLAELATEALVRGDHLGALRCFEAAVETAQTLEAALGIGENIFGEGGIADVRKEFGFALRATGKRALYLFLTFFELDVYGRLSVVEGEARRVLWLTADSLAVETSGGASTPDVVHYAVRRGLIEAAQVKEISHKRKTEGRTLASILLDDGYLQQRDWTRILTDKMVDEIYDIFFWTEPFIELESPPIDAFGQGQSSLRLQMPYSVPGFLEDLKKNFERVRRYLAAVPSVRSVFVDTREEAERPRDVASLFNGRRSVSDVLAIVRWARRDILHYLHRALDAGQLRALEPEEYEEGFERAVAEGRHRDAQTLCFSAIDAEIDAEGYKAKLDQARYAEEESRPSVLEGDFESVSLADVLQSLHRKRLSGALEVSDPKRTKTIYFQNGDVFLLRKEEAHTEFARDFFDTGMIKTMTATWSDLIEKGLVNEDEVSEDVALELKNEVWEMFLWEGARFTFERNVLPAEFFDPESRATRLMLKTDAFLLEAVRRINEWEDLKRRIRDPRTVFRFVSPERKMQAITEMGCAEVLLLLDGRRAFAEVIRVSGSPRVEVYRLIADLEDAEAVIRLESH